VPRREGVTLRPRETEKIKNLLQEGFKGGESALRVDIKRGKSRDPGYIRRLNFELE